MTTLYPAIEPYAHGMLDVGDGHIIYWETCGNSQGKPTVVLHGGPGSGCTAGMRRYFDPDAYRIILFDQRNCGRSTPHASDRSIDLATNTTHHLVADMEKLREHLQIERWMVFGGSWGSTLGLAYAETFPKRVKEMVILGVTMTRPSEIDWLYRGMAPLFPEQWAQYRAGVPADKQDGDLVEAYYQLLHDSDANVSAKAAKDFHDWEAASMSIDPNAKPNPRWLEPEYRMARARIVTHYFRNHAWLEDGILLQKAGALNGIPSILIQGRLDLNAPLVTAWELSKAWPTSELVIVQDAGHTASDAGMTAALFTATNRFARTGT